MMTAMEIYEKLCEAYGRPRWWSDDPYQVIVQAVLVQNTAWASVEKVTANIKNQLSPDHIANISADELEDAIRPCGFCKAKARTIKAVTNWYQSYGYDVEKVKDRTKDSLRKELLAIKGVGNETADVILIYAFFKPSFVIDAYTRRFLVRLGYRFENEEEIRNFFELGLPEDAKLYGWYHWLILDHCIQKCRKTPLCHNCQLPCKAKISEVSL